MRVRDENEFPPEWADDQYSVEVFFSKDTNMHRQKKNTKFRQSVATISTTLRYSFQKDTKTNQQNYVKKERQQ